MATKLISILSIIGASLLLWGCPYDCYEAQYDFKLPNATLEPLKDTIKVGEIIWFTYNFSDILRDEFLQKEIHFPNAKFCFIISPRKLIGNLVLDASSNFEQIIETGELGKSCMFSPIYINNEYNLRVGYKALQPGNYFLRLTNFKANKGNECGENDAFVSTSFPESRQNIKTYFDHFKVDYSTIDEYSLSNMFGFVVEE
jgi:hypothetical protein